MSTSLRKKLLEVSGVHWINNGRLKESYAIPSPHYSTHTPSTTTYESDDSRATSEPKNGGQGSVYLRRRFLLRLAVALHSYGSSASRTEYLIEKAANRLNIEVDIAVFPALILMSFPDVNHGRSGVNSNTLTTAVKDVHLLTVDANLDVDKLGRADELANKVGKEGEPLVKSYLQLKKIATSPPEFGKWWRLFSFALSASMAAPLFFEGNMWDACFCFVLGLVVGIMDIIASRSSVFATVLEFIVSLVVSVLAQLLSVHLQQLKLCFSSMALSSLVNLLPGMKLTLGISEMVSKSYITGTSRIMNSLFSALLLGFGLNIGEKIVWWAPVDPACQSNDLSEWWNVLWFVGYTVASNVLLNARWNQWLGMTLTSGVGYLLSVFASMKFGSNAATVVASFAVGLTGALYSCLTGELPLVTIVSGILLLVPGGIGVQGVAAMLEEDVLSGMGFVFDMIVVGLSITIGLLIARIVLPAGLFGAGENVASNRSTLAAQLEEDQTDDEDEHMAL
ncbi:hypothetical protein O6H91_16G027900 [Diphasiastrum complanatum]|uniref:Uncharacterized protein n=1 Tax=Diphasiastrum complanatum TaxID=34168 RepID=A0ACC2BBY1_DIPCM|nr:hypothetical protein O6H91_16G027900 [Diphasiastrum complanatum]